MSDATTKPEWTIKRTEGGSLALVRYVECVICCKRKRHLCKICHGTGIREAEYGISASDAAALARALGELL